MRQQILALLRAGGQVSGEEISRVLHISRAAVSKHIMALRDQGYQIDSAPRRGYCLRFAPDLLTSAEISPLLAPASPWRIDTYQQLDSTTAQLRRQAEEGCGGYQVVIAEEQSAGQGRLGRPWHSPSGGGLWMSLLLRPTLPPSQAQLVTLTTAVAVAEALIALGFTVGIKWPNDVLTPDHRKLCGIKCEMRADLEQVEWLIVGLGLNINNDSFPPELSAAATCLKQLNHGQPLRRAQVAAAVLDRLAVNLDLLQSQGFAPVRAAWLRLAIGVGEMAEINTLSGRERGQLLGLDDEGYLLLEQEGQAKRVLAGDLLFPERPVTAPESEPALPPQ